jgi:hypothetical protein
VSYEGFERGGDLLLLAARKSRSSLEELTHLAGWASPSFLLAVNTHQIINRDIESLSQVQ